MNTLDFLRLILPPDGLKALFVLPARRHVFTNSLEELAQSILTADGLAGNAVYHACGVFAQGSTNRWQANAVGAKALWVDVDAGQGKPYPNAKAAATAVGEFAIKAGLPIPLMVCSGSGIHAYWPLEEMLPKGEWHLYATGLKAACEEFGLLADPARTADIASILRTPGTYNRKREPAELVRVVYQAGPFKAAQLAMLAGKGRPMREKPAKVDPLTASLMHVQDYPDVYADDMAAGCAQIAWLRDERGAVPEPAWHALSGALAFAVDGQEKALQWASGGYDGAILEKFQRAAALSGPTSCDAIQQVCDTRRCQGCPLFGQGRNPTMVRPPQHKPAATSAPIVTGEIEGETPDNGDDWHLPENFRLNANSLVMQVPTNAGNLDVVVCQHAVILTGTARAEGAEDKYSYVFHRYEPRNDYYVEFSVPAKTMMSQGGLSEIAARGGSIQQTDKFMQYLRAAVPIVQASEDEMVKYEQFGWKGDNFLLGNRLFMQGGGVEPAVGSPEVENKCVHLRPRGGSLAGWTRAANKLFVSGSEAQSLALLASFAAPLMKFQSGDEGGAVLSLIGRSGTGKSTTLAAAASVWGRDKGVTIKNDDTYNAKFISLGVLCNLPVVYDEVHATDPELIKKLIITFTNGSDRARGTTDGGLVQRSNGWQTLMITGSNPSMVEIIGSLPGSDAAGKRILELIVSMPTGTDHKAGDELKRQFEINAGWAGQAYLQSLMEPGVLEYVKGALKKYTDDIWTKTNLPSEYRFWVRSIGAIAVAAVLVKRLGIIEFSPQRIVNWAIEEMKAQAGQMAIDPAVEATDMLAQFLNEHVNDTLVVQREWKQRETDNATLRLPSRQLVVRYETENKQIIIDESRLRKWFLVHGNGNYKESVRALREAGVVRWGAYRKTLGAGTSLPSGQIPVVLVDAARKEFSGFTLDIVKDSNVINMPARN